MALKKKEVPKKNTTETYLAARLKTVCVITLSTTLVVSLLLFDIRFSIAGDDSAFVVRAYDFIRHFTYPGFSGPLYPMVLSPLVLLFGIHAVPLKSLSMLFILGFMYFFYRAYRKRISATLLAAGLALMSVNSFLLYYASQTYSEAFFLFLQSLVFFVFFTFFIDPEARPRLRTNLLLAVCVLVLGLSRTVGFTTVLVFILWFLLNKQWKNLVYFLLSFILVFVVFQGLKSLLWGGSGFYFTTQFQNLVAKNYYDINAGTEDLQGFLNRIAGNTAFYFSDGIYNLLGLRDADPYNTVYPLLGIFTWILLLAATVFSFRRNKYLLFTGVYMLVSVFSTFVLMQGIWRQNRLIITWFPFILLMLLSLFRDILNLKALKNIRWIFILVCLILFLASLRVTFRNISETGRITDKYYGLTPDWENYCRLSEWSAANLPKRSLVACRKPSISFIYGNGRPFFGITRYLSAPGNSVLNAESQQRNSFLFVKSSSIDNVMLSGYLYYTLKRSLVGIGSVIENAKMDVPFLILRIPDTARERTFSEMSQRGIVGTADPELVRTWFKSHTAELSVIYPDTLVAFLKNAGVTHVIEANLRADAARKTDQISNTVERYMQFIQFKYPEFLVKVNQVGAGDNEPASLYEIRYP